MSKSKTTNVEHITRKEFKKLEDEFEMSWLQNTKIHLELAGIFYINAILQFKEATRHFKKLEIACVKYNQVYEQRAKKYKITSDSFYTYMLPRLRNIEVFYEPVVRYFSTGKILLVCCAETYINEVAAIDLKGRSLVEFDKLSILGKWIFIQDVLKFKKRITVDRNPLQGLAALISERNKLVHFKGLNKKLNPFVIPDFLNDLNLTPSKCAKNVEAVKELLKDFSSLWTGSSGPDWLNADRDEYRNPCFYIVNRQVPMILYSRKHDKGRFE